MNGYSHHRKSGGMLYGQRIAVLAFTVTLCITCACITVFLIYSFTGLPSVTPNLDVRAFVAVIGMLYTFASLIIGLFGIINYFQSSEALRRLTELEIEFRQNARDLIVMRVFVLILSNAKIMKTVQDTRIAGSFMIHCFRIADAKDLTSDDKDSIFDLQVSFIEVLKLGGLEVCSE